MLAARQGDPEAPACGTNYAHRQRLAAELNRSLAECGLAASDHPSLKRGLLAGHISPTRHSRSPADIQHDLQAIDGEIELVQSRIDEIDRQLAKGER